MTGFDRDSPWVSLEGELTATKISALHQLGHIEKLSFTKCNLITARIARAFNHLESVEVLWLWSAVTRTAMREVLTIPNLKTLDVLEIRHPGHLLNTDRAESLLTFRANHYMSEEDLFAVAKFPALKELGAQNAAISEPSLTALLEMPSLTTIDLEGSDFDDDMAQAVSQSELITSLDLGGTRLTGVGLTHLSGMKQLQALDIWANDISAEDLGALADLPNLEYLSVGGYSNQETLSAKEVLPTLARIPALKRVWLDGIPVSEEEQKVLEESYQQVRF